MKRIKKLITAFLAIALVAFMPGLGSVPVNAETAHTYTVKYIPEMSEWRVQQLSSWDSSRENGAMSFLWGNLRDGDSLVIVGGSGSPKFEDLHINYNLANLTLYEVTGSVIVYADKHITDVYVLKGSVASVHGSYDNVYVYDNSACNVNNDVNYLYIGAESTMSMNVTAVGTVGHAKIENKGTLVREMYNVAANSLRVVNGEDKTDASTYSTSATATPAASTAASTSKATSSASSGIASPKTGEDFAATLLLAGAAICFFGAAAAKRRAKA